MKKNLLILLSITLVLGLGYTAYSHRDRLLGEKETEEENEPFMEDAFDFWTASRSYPNADLSAPGYTRSFELLKADMRLRSTQVNAASTAPWTPLAPMNFSGRILCVAASPASANTMFVGSASGGLWKTTTGGTGGPNGISWTYVPTGYPVLGVGAIAINPKNANEMYIGTGEVYNKNDKGVTAGGHIRTYRGFYGIGILKSIDGGTTWAPVLSFAQSNLEGVHDMVINPSNPNTVFAATTAGLYRTNDGGTSWTLIHNVTMATDLAMKPTDTSVLYLACGNFGSAGNGLYKSVNAGAASPTFTKMASVLPSSFTGMARISISPSTPTKVYASIGHTSGATTKYGLYVSTNEGSTWAKASSTNIINNQGWYAHDVVIDPANANTVYWSEIDIYKSTNSGSTLSKVSDWSAWNLANTTVGTTTEGTSKYVHADNHRLYFLNGALYSCTDGGLFKSTNGGSSWISLNGGLQTAQIYPNISAGRTDPNYMLCGLQDNGNFVYRGIPGCARVIGADGFSTAIDPKNDNNGFAEYYFFNLYKSTNKGSTFPTQVYTNSYSAAVIPNENACFNSPFVFAFNNTSIMYAGTIYLKKSVNQGSTWTNMAGGTALSGANNPIIALATAPTDDNVVYASAAPGGGIRNKIYMTTDGGTTKADITGTLPDRYYSKIAVDPFDKNRLAVTLSGFGVSHVFISYDAGTNWSDIGAGLPDVPHNTITFDPNNTSIIYVGNDVGVYYCTNVPVTYPGASATVNWASYNEGFTDATLVSDILVTSSNKLRLATHGRGLWERDLAVAPGVAPQLSELSVRSGNDQDMVTWKARHEGTVDRYVLEYSTDGSSFRSVGSIAPSTRSEGIPNLYQLNNKSDIPGGYYRVHIMLSGGQSLYSGMVRIQGNFQGSLRIYPNPVKTNLTMDLQSTKAGQVNVQVVDYSGRIILNRSYGVQQGRNTLSLPMQQVGQGAFRLVVTGVVTTQQGFLHIP
jgi:hypothetical protein